MYKTKNVLRSLSPQNKSLSPPQNSKYSVLQQSKQHFENISPDRYKSSLQMTNSFKRFFPDIQPNLTIYNSKSPERYTYSITNMHSTRQFSNSPKMSPKMSPKISPVNKTSFQFGFSDCVK